uniref:Crumbs cell polarity complex component 1 n=1 Tax=Neogobius melanostomus TaxID=47308 RepID=A0A8C6SDU1_9GOBI
ENAVAMNPTAFLGCFRDIFVDSQMVLPASTTDYIQTNVTLGCSNKDICVESPCQNRGRCVSQGWRSYTCECHRPYEGPHCEKEYVTARFGNKDQESYAVFSLDDDPGNTLIVSMFVRTRQSSGLLLILANSTSQYLRLWLQDGIVNVQVNNFETLVGRSVISDGHFHLLTVTLEGTTAILLQSAQNQGSANIRHIQANSGDSVYVGGLTDPRASASFGGYFKGCVQDLRINNKRLQFYPVEAMVKSNNLQQLINVEQGCSSDNACAVSVNPCLNGGVCYSMWDDFICNCPPNTAGRRCEKVKWCEMSPCPTSAVCQLHSQGFDCEYQTKIPLHYRSHGKIKHSFNRFSISFRTRQTAATLLHAQKDFDFFTMSLIDSQLTLQLQVGFDQNVSVVHTVGPVSDGLWHTVDLKIENSSTMQTPLWILALDRNKMLIDGSRMHPQALDFLREETDIFLGGLNKSGGMKLSGCLGPAEIGGLVLPFHKDTELNFPRPQPEQFVRVDGNTVNLQYGCWGASVCDPNPCQNGGVCEDVFDLHQCTCLSEWTGLLCQESTDRCLSSPCVFGNCSSMSGEYKCDCELGYEGHQCESEVNVCENSNCSNGATCLQGLKNYACLCPQNLTGQYCKLPQLPVAACIGGRWNYSCYNGGNCSKDDNSCHCLPGFIGEW